MKRKFIKFLKEKGCYDKFKKNFKNRVYGIVSLRKFCKRTNPENYIMTAFFWGTTPEKTKFWKIKEWEWIQLLKKEGLYG